MFELFLVMLIFLLMIKNHFYYERPMTKNLSLVCIKSHDFWGE